MQCDEWIRMPSKTFPGKFYYFNMRNGKTSWCSSDAENGSGRPLRQPEGAQNHEHLGLNDQLAPGQQNLFNPQHIPDTRYVVTPFTSIPHSTANPVSYAYLCTPTFNQMIPEGLPVPDESNGVTTRISNLVPISLGNQGIIYLQPYPTVRDLEGFTNTQNQHLPRCQEVCTHASNMLMNQRVVNFEPPSISFSNVNKENVKRLSLKHNLSTAITTLTPFKDPRLANQPKTVNSIIKEPNFGLSSENNKQDMNVGLPTKTEETKIQNFCVSTTTEPVLDNDLLPKSREPLLVNSNGRNRAEETSLGYKSPLNTKELYVNFGPPTKITESIVNLKPPLSTKEPVVITKPPPETKQPILNDELQTKNKETLLNFDPPLNTNDSYLNSGLNTGELSNQYFNVGPSSKTKEPDNAPLLTNVPVSNNQPFKAKNPLQNGVPSNLPEREIKQQTSVLNGCVKSLKPCIKRDEGDKTVAKPFDEDLRAALTFKFKKKSQDFGDAVSKSTNPKVSKPETPVKKKVNFNLDHDIISLVSSLQDDDEMKCAFIERYRPIVAQLKALGPPGSPEQWNILVGREVLTKDFEFINQFVQIDPTCKLLIPAVAHSWLVTIARSSCGALATAARNVLRVTTTAHVIVEKSNNEENHMCVDDAIFQCCMEHVRQGKHVVLISNQPKHLSAAKCYPFPCYSVNCIKNGLVEKKSPLQNLKGIQITIRNDDVNIKNDSVAKKSSNDDDKNEKVKAVIKNLQISKSLTENKANIKELVQNGYLNERFLNEQTNTDPTKIYKNLREELYRSENKRLADAIELTSLPSSVNNTETHENSIITTIRNKSMDTEKSRQSPGSYKSIEQDSNKVKITEETEMGFVSDMSISSIEEDSEDQKVKIEDIDNIASLKFKNNNNSISEENNKQKERDKDNQKPHYLNRDPRLERRSSDSILRFCKETYKEPPKNEFENGKTNFAFQKTISGNGSNYTFSQYNRANLSSEFERTNMSSEFGRTNLSSEFDRTNLSAKFNRTNLSSEFDRTNLSSEFDRLKSNMESTSLSCELSKLQTNNIDINRYFVHSVDMEQKLRSGMDEWIYLYSQIMEETLHSVLELQPASVVGLAPPWTLPEALRCVCAAYTHHATVHSTVSELYASLYDEPLKMKKYINPEDFMRALRCGVQLLEYFEKILPSIIKIQDGKIALEALLDRIIDDPDSTTDLIEPFNPTPLISRTDELDARGNYVKDKSEVIDYLEKHFPAWKDYDATKDVKIVRTRGYKSIYLENKPQSFMKHCRDKTNVDDMNLFGLDRDDKNILRKKNYDSNKTGAMTSGYNRVENNIDIKTNKAKDGKRQDENGPAMIKNGGVLNKVQTKLRKRKTKPVYVDEKEIKKPKSNAKNAKNNKTNNGSYRINANVYINKIKTDPKLLCIPKVVINTNLISDYEKMIKKRKDALHGNNKDHHSKKHDKYVLHSHNDNNDKHIVTNVVKQHNERENSDLNDKRVVNNNNDNNNVNINEDTDNNNNKDMNTDTWQESPRSIVDFYAPQIEKISTVMLGRISSDTFVDSTPLEIEQFRMKAFEAEFFTTKLLAKLEKLLQLSGDPEERAKNVAAVKSFMPQAASTREVATTILSLTDHILPSFETSCVT